MNTGNDASQCFGDVHVLRVTEKSQALQWEWQQPVVAPCPLFGRPSPRTGHAAVVLGAGRFLLVRGGWDLYGASSTFFRDSFMLDLHTWTWRGVPRLVS